MSASAEDMFANVGRTLRLLREKAGVSQGELARRSGIGKSQLSKYESGKELPKLPTLARLLEALEAEPLTFFYSAHLLEHWAEMAPATLLVTTTRPHDDPALESFRRLFGHFLESFEAVMASRLLQSPPFPHNLRRS